MTVCRACSGSLVYELGSVMSRLECLMTLLGVADGQ
jgi:hypothetical protein